MIRRILLGLLLVVVVGLGLGYQLWYKPARFAVDIGSAMLAKQICSCVFVAGRSFEDCRADQFESMDPIQAEVSSAPEGVRAFVPGLGERVAIHREGLGCMLE